jgi:signal transduction histidine kinase
MFRFNRDGYFVDTHQGQGAYLYPPQDFLGKHVSEVLPESIARLSLETIEAVLRTGEIQTFEYTLELSDGPHYYESRMVPCGVSDTLAISRDITKRRQAEMDLLLHQQEQAEMAALKEADRIKDEFLSIISHELRTPLNAIMGFGSLLQDEIVGHLTPKQQTFLAKIAEGADRMLSLINDILDFTKMQAGKFEIAFETVDYQEVVNEAVAFLEPLAIEKAITLEYSVDVPQSIQLDRVRIQQVLTNLIHNAIKFTPRAGRIRVMAWVENATLMTQVEDTGIGIASKDLPKLFLPFRQLDMSLTRSVGGTGLGLSISKGIIEAHGGNMLAKSPGPGMGSTFGFWLPL